MPRKNPHASALGKLGAAAGASKAGKASAAALTPEERVMRARRASAKMTPEERISRARKAAMARWGKIEK